MSTYETYIAKTDTGAKIPSLKNVSILIQFFAGIKIAYRAYIIDEIKIKPAFYNVSCLMAFIDAMSGITTYCILYYF